MVLFACLHPSLASSSRVSILYASLPVFPFPYVCDAISISRRPPLPPTTAYTTSLANVVSVSTSPGTIAKSGVIMEPRDNGGNGLMPSGIPHRYGWASILLVHHISTSDGIELPSSRKDPIYSRGRSHVVRFNGAGNRAWGFMNHLGTTSRLPRDIEAGHAGRSWSLCQTGGPTDDGRPQAQTPPGYTKLNGGQDFSSFIPSHCLLISSL